MAEPIHKFQELPKITFEFPGLVNTILFVHSGFVHASLHGGEDYFEIVGRLYSTYHPNQNEEKHVGKIYIRVIGNSNIPRFETNVEKYEWNPDGSFNIINADG